LCSIAPFRDQGKVQHQRIGVASTLISFDGVHLSNLRIHDLPRMDSTGAWLDSPQTRRDLGMQTEKAMTVSIKDLESFAEGWNRHDVDFLMTFMAEGCVFETSAGPEAAGKRYVGREQVREGFAGVFRRFPDVHFGDARHLV
jgi:SnoaL-like domain